jgi:hypothetical protein
MSRFGYFSTQKLYTSHQNFVIYMRTTLALDNLCCGIYCVWYILGRFSSNYLFLKWQYSSIGPQIMTNFVKIGTRNLLNPGKLTYSFDWLLILDTFAHQSSSSWNLKTAVGKNLVSHKPQAKSGSRRQDAGFIYKLQFLKICLKKSILKSRTAICYKNLKNGCNLKKYTTCKNT